MARLDGMSSFSRSFPKPRNSEDFESLCRALLKEHWSSLDIQKNARRGQEQHGVDLYGHTPEKKLNGAQCKLHEEGKRLTKGEVLEEVEKAKTFAPPLAHYVIATTSPTDPTLQLLARELTQDHQAVGIFSVEVMSWDAITELLNEYAAVARRFEGTTVSTVVIQSPAQRIDLQIIDGGAAHHAEIDQARDLLVKGEIPVAVAKLQELRNRTWERLSERERFRVLANMGHAFSMQGAFEKAGRAYVESLGHQRDDPDALALGAVGFKYLGDLERARELATKAHEQRPDSPSATSVWIREIVRRRRTKARRGSIQDLILENFEALKTEELSLRDLAKQSGRSRDSLSSHWSQEDAAVMEELRAGEDSGER